MNDEKLVDIRDVTKVFRRDHVEVLALDQIDLAVFPGDFVCLMGPSGSGKSLLNIIAGVDRPTSGGVSSPARI
jgi:putative ABC transport system ATP-binding protein